MSLNRTFASLVFAVAAALPVTAAQAQRVDPAAFYRQFSDSGIRAIEYDLIWIGGSDAVTNGRIGRTELSTIRRFERQRGLRADGVLRRAERRELRRAAERVRAEFGYRIVDDRETGMRIGVPTALVGAPQPTPRGAIRRGANGTIALRTVRLPEANLRRAYRRLTNRLGRQVSYKIVRSRWFVVTGEDGGRSFYTRARTDGREVRLFTFTYPNALKGQVDRAIVAMSNDFSAFAGDPQPRARETVVEPATDCAPRIRVARGETLARIAARCGTTVNRLRRANGGLDPLDLQAGQTLRIPRDGERLAALPEPRSLERRTAEPLASEPSAAEPTYAPAATIAPRRPVEGRGITVVVTGFPPRTALEAGFTRTGNRFRMVDTARTDADGSATLRLNLPEDLDAGQSAAVLVTTPDRALEAASERFMVRSRPIARADDDSSVAQEPIVVSGMTTEEGVGCATMRDARGRRYNLLGAVADYEPGTAVRIIGFPTSAGGCGEGTTLDVTQIERRP